MPKKPSSNIHREVLTDKKYKNGSTVSTLLYTSDAILIFNKSNNFTFVLGYGNRTTPRTILNSDTPGKVPPMTITLQTTFPTKKFGIVLGGRCKQSQEELSAGIDLMRIVWGNFREPLSLHLFQMVKEMSQTKH